MIDKYVCQLSMYANSELRLMNPRRFKFKSWDWLIHNSSASIHFRVSLYTTCLKLLHNRIYSLVFVDNFCNPFTPELGKLGWDGPLHPIL